MSGINARIKKIREAMNLTQEEFGKKIGSARNTIANYENGNRTPSNAIVTSICREFDVDENWLRTGEGEMFSEMDVEKSNHDIVNILASLDTDDWALLIHTARVLYGKKNGGVTDE